MSIAVFSNFVNGIPTTIYDGKDVSMVMLVDPPANLPAFFLAGKGILDTTTQTIKVYDETGNTVIHNFDISGTDLTPINEAISALEGRVDTNETNISTLQSDVSTNATDIGNNASDIDNLQGRTSTLESTSSKHTTDIIALQSVTGGNASDISALTLRVGQNETDIAAVLITANAADTLSKQNKDRLDNLLPPPSLEGYIKTGDDAALNSVSFGDNTKIDTQPDLGLVLQGDYIYGKADSGLEHFFVESGNFNVKSKKIQKVNDGQAVDDAVNLRQLGAVETKADDAQSTANAADTLSKANQSDISTLSTTVGGNTAQISTNTKDIGDLGTKVDEVEITATAADTLSKNNEQRLNNLPEGGGLKPTDNTWEMLGYPVLNIGSSTISTSAATVGQVNVVDGKTDTNATAISSLSTTVGQHDSQISANTSEIASVKTTATNADTLSKDNETRLDNLPPAPDLSGYAKLGTSVNFAEITSTGLDFTGKGSNAEIKHDHNINVSVGNNINVAFKSSGMKLLSPVDGHGQVQNNLGDFHFSNGKKLFGDAIGGLEVVNLGAIKRNSSTDSNSITLGSGNNTYQSDSHFFKNGSGGDLLSIGTNVDVKNRKIQNVNSAVSDKDVPNFSQVKNLVSASLVEWFEVAHGNLASNGNRPTGGSSDSNLNVWHTSVAASTTNPNNELKIAYNGAYNKVKVWSYPLRYKLVQGDKVQYWNVGANGWLSGSNVWHLSADSVEGDDLALGTDTVVYASQYMVDSGGDSPQEMDGFKKYITTSTAGTYYEHQGDSHLYIDWTGNGGVISLDTMRNGGAQQEDIFMLHNKTDTEMSVRFFFNGSSVTQIVAGRSFIQGWANRNLGKWVIGTYKDPSFVPEQLVVKATDLSWSTSSDPRVNTQRMVAAAPDMCTIIGRHISNGNAKEKIVSVGDSNRLESQTSTFVVNKHSSGHATGICTSEENSGKTWSRILDGKRGAWFTNESANSRMASGDIVPSEYPEEQIFFTTDQGIMETYVDEADGEIKLRPLEGYNVPKNEADIAALEVQTEKNRSVTHYFINEETLSYEWPDETRRPLAEVGVLNTTQTINNSSVTVTDNDTHSYSGNYNTVGSIAINSSGDWTNQYTYHNCYKHVSEDYYVVFNQGNASWQIIESANPHTSIGSHAASVTVQLGGQTSLPSSFGDYVIDPNFDNIDSLEFLTAEVPIQYDDVNSRVIINFSGAKPSGYVVLK
ncbi:hypothetical protein VPH166E361_0012 [Vibrio phage 166E36-1]